MSENLMRNFSHVLQRLSRGRFANECDAKLKEALETLEALPNEKGTAEITIKLKLSFDKGRIDVKPEVKSKLPDGQAFSASPFWLANGGLSTQHPDQVDFFPRGKDGVGVDAEPETETG